MNDQAGAVGHAIAEELASCDVKLVASLPDNWLTGVIHAIDRDARFVHVRVNREEAAVANAVIDALWHLGVRDITLPIKAETVWRALHAARACPAKACPRA